MFALSSVEGLSKTCSRALLIFDQSCTFRSRVDDSVKFFPPFSVS